MKISFFFAALSGVGLCLQASCSTSSENVPHQFSSTGETAQPQSPSAGGSPTPSPAPSADAVGTDANAQAAAPAASKTSASLPTPTPPSPPSLGPVTQPEPGPAPTPVPAPAAPTQTPAQPPAQANPCAHFTNLDWTNITDPKQFACFADVNHVFAAMPNWLAGYGIFMTTSRSLQPASRPYPRVIVPAPDASVIIAAATDPNALPFLDVATFDFKANEWNFTGVDYSTTPPTVDTQSCPACHGTPVHPIWSPYAFWTGALTPGDSVPGSTAAFFDAVGNKTTGLPLVDHLLCAPGCGRRGGQIYPDGLTLSGESYGESTTNQILNFVVAKGNNRRLANKLLNDPKVSSSMIYALVAANNCGSGQDFNSLLAAAGYPFEKYEAVNLTTKDTPDDINIGFANLSHYLAIDLMRGMLQKDTTLAAKIPGLVKVLTDPNLAGYNSSSIKDFLAAAPAMSGWLNFDFNWYPTYRSALSRGSAACNVINSLGQNPAAATEP